MRGASGVGKVNSRAALLHWFIAVNITLASPSKPLSGVFPIAPTPFTDSGDIDIDGQRRVLDCMIDQGVDGICILANYSEQFLLTDAERDTLLDACLSHVKRRVPVIVT